MEVNNLIMKVDLAFDNNKVSNTKELLNECGVKMKKRNKLIRNADTSDGGWETVCQFKKNNPVVSD